MPERVPTKTCLNAVFAALRTAGLLNLPGNALLIRLNDLAGGQWQPKPTECQQLDLYPRSLALATSLALLWPAGKWNAEEAVHEFRNIATELTDAWKDWKISKAIPKGKIKAQYEDELKLRRTVDHAVVCGIRRNWDSARDVLTAALLGDPQQYISGRPPRGVAEGPIGASILVLAGRPLARNQLVDSENARGAEADGLIPDLEHCWGGDFRQDGNAHAGAIRNKLLQPLVRLPLFSKGQHVDFTWVGDKVLPPFSTKPVLEGSRRNFRLESGAATLLHNGTHFAYVGTGQRLILRVFDDAVAELQLAQSRGGSVGGHTLEFRPTDTVRLQFCAEEGSVLEVWNCTCGALACDEHHRLSAWNPSKMAAETTLSSFLATAVKGPTPGFHINSFIQGMYYALLCDGE